MQKRHKISKQQVLLNIVFIHICSILFWGINNETTRSPVLETTITNKEHISSTASLAETMHSSAKSSVESAEAIYSNYTHTSLTSRSMILATGSRGILQESHRISQENAGNHWNMAAVLRQEPAVSGPSCFIWASQQQQLNAKAFRGPIQKSIFHPCWKWSFILLLLYATQKKGSYWTIEVRGKFYF